jgi:hypothetical protein
MMGWAGKEGEKAAFSNIDDRSRNDNSRERIQQ